ncbi:methyltransferase [Billgrantia pellis]|uniref:Methyltransferase n=1 Tax=Billgrantia pellis TaxID=2606936 RepID=A0A7V7G5G5_9GAMM|nr:methyltransferase [Halomonas pellis]KAA0013839.1 methyltransferase [Halomonas pellis]
MPKPPESNTDYRFRRLTEHLAEWQLLWRPLPFMHRQLPWRERYPGLAECLLGLGESEVERLQADPWRNSPLRDWLPVDELAELVALPSLDAAGATLPEAWGRHVGGRKWRQIDAFVRRLPLSPGESVVEWCAGKGHLARALVRRYGIEATGLEWQPALCEKGRRLATDQGVALQMQEQDVLASDAARWLGPGTHVAALHACGDLHLHLLELAAATGSSVSLAPCCYQRTRDATYRPLSRRGASLYAEHALSFSREDLALAVQETVTAPQGVRRNRERASAWRLGFDALQRQLRGVDAYLPVPSLAYGRVPQSFEAFCRWAAARKSIPLRGDVMWERYEREGWRRQAEVARLELVRHVFRRPLEIWLLLDRQCRMEEAGFRTELGVFCAPELTPRNLLLRASKE